MLKEKTGEDNLDTSETYYNIEKFSKGIRANKIDLLKTISLLTHKDIESIKRRELEIILTILFIFISINLPLLVGIMVAIGFDKTLPEAYQTEKYLHAKYFGLYLFTLPISYLTAIGYSLKHSYDRYQAVDRLNSKEIVPYSKSPLVAAMKRLFIGDYTRIILHKKSQQLKAKIIDLQKKH